MILQSENGIVGTGAKPGEEEVDPEVTDAGGAPAAVRLGGSFCSTADSFGLIRGGHVNATFLGALQVDAEGSLANWTIPGKRVTGMGGAMDLVVGAKRVIVTMEHTQKGTPKILDRCTLPLTAAKIVEKIITEMCVLEVRPDGLHLTEINPEFTVADVQAATAAGLVVPAHVKPMC